MIYAILTHNYMQIGDHLLTWDCIAFHKTQQSESEMFVGEQFFIVVFSGLGEVLLALELPTLESF